MSLPIKIFIKENCLKCKKIPVSLNRDQDRFCFSAEFFLNLPIPLMLVNLL